MHLFPQITGQVRFARACDALIAAGFHVPQGWVAEHEVSRIVREAGMPCAVFDLSTSTQTPWDEWGTLRVSALVGVHEAGVNAVRKMELVSDVWKILARYGARLSVGDDAVIVINGFDRTVELPVSVIDQQTVAASAQGTSPAGLILGDE